MLKKHGAPCKMCSHPSREEIEDALVLKESSYDALARRFTDMSADAIRRHMTNHVGTKERKEIYARAMTKRELDADAKVADDKINVIASLKRLSKECEGLLKQAKAGGDGDLALRTIAELRRQVELAAKILGDLTEVKNQTVIVQGHPAWLQIRDVLLEVLERHPDAKADFVRTFGKLAGGRRSLVDGSEVIPQ